MAYDELMKCCMVLLFWSLAHWVGGEQQVPCLFIFGDSLVDNGNNNGLPTLAKCNFLPYGTDFQNGNPTGRSTNGRTVADITAELLGFKDYIASFANSSRANVLLGMSHASTAAGIRDESGKTLLWSKKGCIIWNRPYRAHRKAKDINGIVGDSCDENVNAKLQIFNDRLRSLVDELNNNYTNAKFIYVNIDDLSFAPHVNPSSFGFTETNKPCSEVDKANGVVCIRQQNPCPNRTEYLFWDGVHPTEAACAITAERSYRNQSATDVYPMDIYSLASSALVKGHKIYLSNKIK